MQSALSTFPTSFLTSLSNLDFLHCLFGLLYIGCVSCLMLMKLKPLILLWFTVTICVRAHGCSCHMEVMAASPSLVQLSTSEGAINLPLCDCALALGVVGQRFMLLLECHFLLLICPLVNQLPRLNYVFRELF